MSLPGGIVGTAWMGLASRPPILTERVGQVKPENRDGTPPRFRLTRPVTLGHPNYACGVTLRPEA